MFNLKRTLLLAATVGTLTLAPVEPAAAVVPWLLGRHVVEAIVGLATLPLAVASSGGAAPAPTASYPGTPAYGAPTYYAPPAYYARPPAYYPGPLFYRPAARPAPRFYGVPRGYYASGARYTGGYGAHVPYQSGKFAYRRR